jgi:heterodisulfide reductase subunit C
MELDMPRIMDTLRRFAISEDYKLKEKNILLFHRLFLESLKRWGRVHELELIGLYKLKSKNLIQDLRLGVKMFLKGKLSIFPQTNKDRKSIREIFERCMQKR